MEDSKGCRTPRCRMPGCRKQDIGCLNAGCKHTLNGSENCSVWFHGRGSITLVQFLHHCRQHCASMLDANDVDKMCGLDAHNVCMQCVENTRESCLIITTISGENMTSCSACWCEYLINRCGPGSGLARARMPLEACLPQACTLKRSTQPHTHGQKRKKK